MMQKENQSLEDYEDLQVEVCGSLVPLLFTSRWVGIMPISIFRKNGFWTIRFSKFMLYYSYCFFIVINICYLLSIYLDINASRVASIRATGGMTTLVWLMKVAMVFIIANIGVITCAKRTKSVVHICLMSNQIHNKLQKLVSMPNLRWKHKAIASFFIVFTFYIQIMNYIKTIHSKGKSNISLFRFVLIIPFYVENMAAAFTGLIFSFIMINIAKKVEHMNLILEQTSNDLKMRTNLVNSWNERISINPRILNHSVDTLQTKEETSRNQLSGLFKNISMKIHQMYEIHGTIFDLICIIENNYGSIIVLLLGSSLLHILVHSYNVIVSYDLTDPFELTMSVSYFIYYAIFFLLRIECCHMTSVQGKKTEKLISEMGQMISDQHPLNEELKVFANHLSICTLDFVPMGIVTISRRVIVTILNSVLSYLVILVQFQINSKQ